MLPDVEGQQGLQSFLHRIGSVSLLRDDQSAILCVFGLLGAIDRKPHPSRAKQRGALLLKLILEGLKRTEITLNSLSQLPRRPVVSLWSTKLPEVQLVVQYLPSIVEHASRRPTDNHFQLRQHQPIELRPAVFTLRSVEAGITLLQQSVKIIHISRQVLPMMESDSLTANHWLQGLRRIRQRHQRKLSHILYIINTHSTIHHFSLLTPNS